MLNLILHRAKFLSLVKQDKITPSLKTFNDTLLFYYVGHLALNKALGNLFEIGVGGSTHVLMNLSEQHQRDFHVVDVDLHRLTHYSNTDLFPDAIKQTHVVSSLDLQEINLTNLCYCHIDGNKDYMITVNDLEYCTQHLGHNGIICQDDYGNHKWPTVTDAVQHMIHTGKLVMLIVGDSSAWLTRPEYYEYWMNQFANDKEFETLSMFVNIRQSKVLNKNPNYLFMQSHVPETNQSRVDDHVIDYYNDLLSFNHQNYLQMPYREQSMPGIRFRIHPTPRYLLQQVWQQLRGDQWPQDPPTNAEEINNLPNWIKQELHDLHYISDLHATMEIIDDACIKNSM
jgi:hypothetical protein